MRGADSDRPRPREGVSTLREPDLVVFVGGALRLVRCGPYEEASRMAQSGCLPGLRRSAKRHCGALGA